MMMMTMMLMIGYYIIWPSAATESAETTTDIKHETPP